MLFHLTMRDALELLGHQRFKFCLKSSYCWRIFLMNFPDDFSGFVSSFECKSSSSEFRCWTNKSFFTAENRAVGIKWESRENFSFLLKTEPLILWSTIERKGATKKQKEIFLRNQEFIVEGEGDWFLQGFDTLKVHMFYRNWRVPCHGKPAVLQSLPRCSGIYIRSSINAMNDWELILGRENSGKSRKTMKDFNEW